VLRRALPSPSPAGGGSLAQRAGWGSPNRRRAGLETLAPTRTANIRRRVADCARRRGG
jgi:hypothetical protein